MAVNQPAFRAEGATVALNVGNTSSNVQVHSGFCSNIRIVNASANAVYVNFGPDNTITAAIPVPGTPANGMAIPAGEVEIVRAPGGWVAAIASVVGPSEIFLTPGQGL